ncbi:MAG: hypothetical protein VCA34_16350 [Roseibacillus sp.]
MSALPSVLAPAAITLPTVGGTCFAQEALEEPSRIGKVREVANEQVEEKGLDRIAIVLNDEVISALVVQAPLKAELIIQGLRDHDELTGLANALNIPLAAELKLESLTALPAH